MSTKVSGLLDRTRVFAIQAQRTTRQIPASPETGVLKRQLIRAATSVGANYRAARRSRTRREFISRLAVVEGEADECLYLLDLLMALEPTYEERLGPAAFRFGFWIEQEWVDLTPSRSSQSRSSRQAAKRRYPGCVRRWRSSRFPRSSPRS